MKLHHVLGRKGDLVDQKEAADWWFARRVLGALSARETALFDQWLQDPVNAAAYERVRKAYEEVGSLAAEPEILKMRSEVLTSYPPVARGWKWQVAVAACGAVLIAVALTILQPAVILVQPSSIERAAPAKKIYETVKGQRRSLTLDDGSVIVLNTDSSVEVAYSEERRDIRLLRGEALFQVAHNSRWPFVVTAGDRSVTAIGTAFNVRVDDAAIKVVLVEGKVRIDPIRLKGLEHVLPALAAESLVAGEQFTAREGEAEISVTSTDVARALSWREGQIVFRDSAMDEAVEEMNRYSDARILIGDRRVAALKVSGVFNTDSSANFVSALTHFYPIEARKTSKGVTELVWREPRGVGRTDQLP